jgi:DNA polymerase/3'-5' exonuclease PolX
MVKHEIDNKQVSTVLEAAALFLELKGENPFKAKPYSHAARTIETLEEDPEMVIREGRLKEIRGIGRKGWLDPGDIFNAMNVGKIKVFLDQRKPV